MSFDDKQQLSNFTIADTPFKASSKMNLGEFTWVEHSNKIRTEKVDSSGNVVEGMVARWYYLQYCHHWQPNLDC
ncbi:hypothetical protein [Abyssogena phaseoliformis symbiont]|uniref:hypothetical protein n=1 Tax=Abyssogena phaseoliformis symbiont TaxID=596095 RepID=UPI0019161588|nr:hypothetical protein [Abyssogena phaseoliformis symbiont]